MKKKKFAGRLSRETEREGGGPPVSGKGILTKRREQKNELTRACEGDGTP